MTLVSALLLIFSLALVPVQSSAARSQAPVSTEPDALLDRFHEAAATADAQTYFSLFTPTGRFLGTDASEQWSVEEFRAYADPYFSQGQGWTYVPQERVIRMAPVECGCVATFDEVLTNESYGQVRGSGTLIRDAGGWKIEHYVLSFTVPNDKARAVVETIRAH